MGAASRAEHQLELGALLTKLRGVELMSGMRGNCGGNPAGTRCPSEGSEAPGGAAASAAGPAAADKNREVILTGGLGDGLSSRTRRSAAAHFAP